MISNFATTFEECLHNMNNTLQCEGMTITQHGEMVSRYYHQMLSFIYSYQTTLEEGEEPLLEMDDNTHKKLYDFYMKYCRSFMPTTIVNQYHLYHDCGKPLCLEVDENGKRHFPNHAQLSYEQYKIIDPDNFIVQELIFHDMDFHVMKGDDIDKLWRNPLAPTLYITAWAELYANAQMFGGCDSTSFKIKRKQLIKALNRLNNTGE